MYQISGKFTPHKDNSFNIVITTSIRLHLVEDYILTSKPIAHLIGNTTNNADLTKNRLHTADTNKTIFIERSIPAVYDYIDPSTQSPNSLLTTTHIVGHRHTLPVNGDKWLIAEATDYQEGICMETQLTQSEFKAKTNLPPTVRLQ